MYLYDKSEPLHPVLHPAVLSALLSLPAATAIEMVCGLSLPDMVAALPAAPCSGLTSLSLRTLQGRTSVDAFVAAFAGLSSLRQLLLRFPEPPDDSFMSVRRSKALPSFPAALAKHCPLLETLALTNPTPRTRQVLPDSIGDLTALRSLTLDNTGAYTLPPVRSVPASISKLASLTYLSFWR